MHVCISSGTASGNRRKPRPRGIYLAEMALAPSSEGWKSGGLLCRCLEFHVYQKDKMFFPEGAYMCPLPDLLLMGFLMCAVLFLI